MSAYRRSLLWLGLGVLVGVLLFASRPSVRALPEYMTRTGEACATCHVNPAGGGPLTARGSLWIATGKPDQVPQVPGGDESPRPTADGENLYDQFGCSGCHGPVGEGASGPALNQAELPAGQLRQVTRDGKGNMPGYRTDVMPDADLAALVQYLQAIGRGEMPAQPNGKVEAMEPVRATCGNGAMLDGWLLHACDGN